MGATFIPDDAAEMTIKQKNHQLSREVGTSPLDELAITTIVRNADGWTVNYQD